MPDLFEFASQVATPDYVAAKIAVAESRIADAHISMAVAAAVLLVCVAVAVASDRKYKKGDQLDLLLCLFVGAIVIGIVALVALFSNFVVSLTLPGELAQWTCDPVTEVATKLADAI